MEHVLLGTPPSEIYQNIIHGKFRCLQHADLERMWESIREA
jgi:hypothetical protein